MAAAVAAAATAGLTSAGATPAAAASGQPILLVHGFAANGKHDCGTYFQQAKSFLAAFNRPVYTVGYYRRDTNCDLYVPGRSNNGTATSIDELGTELALLIMGSFEDTSVDVVAHSMGGLVVRDALDDQGALMRVDDVVTLGTPHEGAAGADLVAGLALPACLVVTQCKEMTSASQFLVTLEQNPQSAVPTHWTVIGTYHDETIGSTSGTSMGIGSPSKPAVVPYRFPSYTRTSSACLPHRVLGHGELVENVSAWKCTPFASGQLTKPLSRVWAAVKD